ncbi:Chromosomal replication initiator, DnaA C-terminal [uncultured Caudovirales phage]|uniref:Chromosomal replication initiator, DnaA C-terminal n=1 Tax=uncultured Caudovirales phage TaxID=2100421 RepID=A0A6J5LX39_9CAUD|nr:Chromosomal replication initiator, DnaA C-terminal [uncultured Caudovirales phage]
MIEREKIKSLIKSHYQMIRRLEKMLDGMKVIEKKPVCEATKIIESVNGIFETDCRERTRRKRVVFARHCACYFLRHYTRMTLEEIAESVGNCDHSTVVNSIKVFHNLNDTDQEYHLKVKEVENILESSKL